MKRFSLSLTICWVPFRESPHPRIIPSLEYFPEQSKLACTQGWRGQEKPLVDRLTHQASLRPQLCYRAEDSYIWVRTMTVSKAKDTDAARPKSRFKSIVDIQVTSQIIWKKSNSAECLFPVLTKSSTLQQQRSSHQINPAASPQSHDIRVLLKHPLQIYEDNGCENSLRIKHTQQFEWLITSAPASLHGKHLHRRDV